MDFRKQRLSCKEANEMDMVEYLSALGYIAVNIRAGNYWYLSPLRQEKTASFKVNRRINRWYDFGEGKGGSLVDFGILFFRCTVSEFLRKLDEKEGGYTYFTRGAALGQSDNSEHKINIIRDNDLHSFSLCKYLHERRIAMPVAEKYCREVAYAFKGRVYNAIGFKNDSGGYELRSPGFKGSSSPKDITTIENGHYTVSVYEGFFDFLSYQAFFRPLRCPEGDYVILNSLAFFKRVRPFMEQHPTILLYLDNDKAGQNCITYATSISDSYYDCRSRYRSFKDLNDWLIHMRPVR